MIHIHRILRTVLGTSCLSSPINFSLLQHANNKNATSSKYERKASGSKAFAISTCIIQAWTDTLMVCKIKEKNSTEG